MLSAALCRAGVQTDNSTVAGCAASRLPHVTAGSAAATIPLVTVWVSPRATDATAIATNDWACWRAAARRAAAAAPRLAETPSDGRDPASERG
jgi:hypothetical protein